jgi:type II secretory pathway pseudopilin PulG
MRRPVPPSEQGYVMLIAIFLMALVIISLAIAAPKVAKSIQRDKDLETYHCGMQYRRAIQLYYRKFHAYPPNLDALVETNQVRFLRKKYVDPITNKADWKPVLFGQNKTPTAMGFFGQPLAGGATSIAGTGPSGGSGGSTIIPGGMGFLTGSSNGSTPTSGSTNTPTDPSAGTGGGTSSTSTTSPGTPSSGSTTSSTSSDQSGQTFGGAGIIGFSPASSKQSILIYKKKNHYNEWEFTYDPISDTQTISGGNPAGIGQPTNGSTPTPGAGSNTNPNNPSGGSNPPPTSSPSSNAPQQL